MSAPGQDNARSRRYSLGGTILFLILPIVCLAAEGCREIGYLGYLVAPEPPAKKVPAEFTGLDHSRVAIVIFTDERVQYEYPYARLTLGSVIRAEMNDRLKGVTVTDPTKVCKYQDEHVHWQEMAKSELAQALGVDYVLDVTLVEYTTREHGSVNLYRGRITAQCAVYQAGLSDIQGRVWHADSISVVYPKTEPIGTTGESDRKVREATDRLLAETLVQKFYEHKVPAEP
jgi:hypothetical protein